MIANPPFHAKESSPRITLVRGDIVRQDVDAVVSTLPETLDISGTLNQSLQQAAGEALDAYILDHIIKPRPWDVYCVPGFKLACRHILFVITPDWRTNMDREDRHILDMYRKPIEAACRLQMTRIAFPALGCGRKGHPLPRASRLALQGIQEELKLPLQEVRIVCNDDAKLAAFAQRFRV